MNWYFVYNPGLESTTELRW